MAELSDNISSNSRGLRGMTYSRYGGNLITFGFETYMNGLLFIIIYAYNINFDNLLKIFLKNINIIKFIALK